MCNKCCSVAGAEGISLGLWMSAPSLILELEQVPLLGLPVQCYWLLRDILLLKAESQRGRPGWDFCSLELIVVQILCSHVPGERETCRPGLKQGCAHTDHSCSESLALLPVAKMQKKSTPESWGEGGGNPDNDLVLPHSSSVLIYLLLLHIFR